MARRPARTRGRIGGPSPLTLSASSPIRRVFRSWSLRMRKGRPYSSKAKVPMADMATTQPAAPTHPANTSRMPLHRDAARSPGRCSAPARPVAARHIWRAGLIWHLQRTFWKHLERECSRSCPPDAGRGGAGGRDIRYENTGDKRGGSEWHCEREVVGTDTRLRVSARRFFVRRHQKGFGPSSPRVVKWYCPSL